MPESTAPQYAMFSRAEMERRYNRAREMMAQRRIDALFVTGEENFQYFVGTTASVALHGSLTRPSAFILPAGGEPVVITQSKDTLIAGSHIKDIREYADLFRFPHELAADALKGPGLKHNRIGVELGQEQRMGIPVGDYLGLVDALPGVAFVDAADIVIPLRMVKSPEELAYMKQAAEVTARARQRLFGQLRPGMSEREVARLMRRLILEEGGDRAAFVIFQLDLPGDKNPFHYDRPLQKGSVLALDAGAYVGMYAIDYVRMATFGKPTDTQQRVHAAVLEVNRRMAESLKPGVTCAELYRIGARAIEAVASKVPGLESFGPPRMGHGQGLLVTEPPSISPLDRTVLEPGMVISTEPGVRAGKVQFLWEDVHVITENGHEQITLETDELREIPL